MVRWRILLQNLGPRVGRYLGLYRLARMERGCVTFCLHKCVTRDLTPPLPHQLNRRIPGRNSHRFVSLTLHPLIDRSDRQGQVNSALVPDRPSQAHIPHFTPGSHNRCVLDTRSCQGWPWANGNGGRISL